MIRRKAIRKIFNTTLSLFIILVIYTISNIGSNNTVRASIEIEDITGITNHSVYLLNDKGYLVRKKIFIESDSVVDSIYKVINYLRVNSNSKYSSRLVGLIPSNIILRDVLYDEGYVSLSFDDNFYDIDNINLVVTSIIYSIYDIGSIDGISIIVGDDYLKGYPKVINKDLDINKNVMISSMNDINKVVIYYIDIDDEEKYYVPVTKYLNDSREKINIIVDEMKSSTSFDLVSLVSSNLELLSSREDNDTLILNFNNYLFDSNNEVLEEVLYCLSYSVFENYDVDMVMVEVNGKNIRQIDRNSV